MIKKPRNIIVSEDYVDLTGDFVKGVILRSLVLETTQLDDFHLFVQEEVDRFQKDQDELKFGWIMKSAKQLSEETLLRLTAPPTRAHLNKIVEMGYLYKKNDEDPFEKTIHYRINLISVAIDLFKLGYRFSEFDGIVDIPFVDMIELITRSKKETIVRENKATQRVQVIELREYETADREKEGTPGERAGNKDELPPNEKRPREEDRTQTSLWDFSSSS